jgi:hypothetical protein
VTFTGTQPESPTQDSTDDQLKDKDAILKKKLVSDSRRFDSQKPFELRIGYSFIVKAMEICVKSMKPGEKSRFLCMNDYIQVCRVFSISVAISPRYLHYRIHMYIGICTIRNVA